MSASVQNLEEAATIASEFIYSLDNLPHEVNHLLQEIKLKDARCQELQQEIDKDSARYIRYQLKKASSSSSTPASASTSISNTTSNPTSRTPSPSPASPASQGKQNNGYLLVPTQIAAAYAEIDKLADEKCALSQRLIELVARTRARLDADLTKVKVLQGETPPECGAAMAAGMGRAGSILSGMGTGAGEGALGFGGGRNPVQQIVESMKNALGNMPAVDVAPSPPATGPYKKRRVASSPSIKLPSRAATPTPGAATTSTMPRSRLSRQIHPPPQKQKDTDIEMVSLGDEDAEGEANDDAEAEDGDDEKLYCFCQKRSYGEMVACDYEGGCPYEWFHLSCVGMKQAPADRWYCPECRTKMGVKAGAAPQGRKGRKK